MTAGWVPAVVARSDDASTTRLAREPELNAGCQCGVEVEVVLGSGGNGLVDLRARS